MKPGSRTTTRKQRSKRGHEELAADGSSEPPAVPQKLARINKKPQRQPQQRRGRPARPTPDDDAVSQHEDPLQGQQVLQIEIPPEFEHEFETQEVIEGSASEASNEYDGTEGEGDEANVKTYPELEYSAGDDECAESDEDEDEEHDEFDPDDFGGYDMLGCYPYVEEDQDDDEDEDDGPLWQWGKHRDTPIKNTPGGYIHWLCREPEYFDGTARKVVLLQQLIAAGKVKIVNKEPVDSPHVEVKPLVADYDEDYGYLDCYDCCCDYWGY